MSPDLSTPSQPRGQFCGSTLASFSGRWSAGSRRRLPWPACSLATVPSPAAPQGPRPQRPTPGPSPSLLTQPPRRFTRRCSRPRPRRHLLFMCGGTEPGHIPLITSPSSTRLMAIRIQGKTFGRCGKKTKSRHVRIGNSRIRPVAASTLRSLPQPRRCVADIAFLSIHDAADQPIHGSAMPVKLTRADHRHPCLGSWRLTMGCSCERRPARILVNARPLRRAEHRCQNCVERLHAGGFQARSALTRSADSAISPGPRHNDGMQQQRLDALHVTTLRTCVPRADYRNCPPDGQL